MIRFAYPRKRGICLIAEDGESEGCEVVLIRNPHMVCRSTEFYKTRSLPKGRRLLSTETIKYS